MSDGAQIKHLIDRQAILDCLTRYCRGMDRFDRALVLSAYHPDAIDDHGARRDARGVHRLGVHTA